MSASKIPGLMGRDFLMASPAREKLVFALELAAQAPTLGNWQSWNFQFAETHLDLIAREDMAPSMHDPEGREGIIGCGTALEYLKVALKRFGCLGRVALFPDLGQPALVARIHFGACGEQGAGEKGFFEAMTSGRANGSRLGGMPVSEMMLAALRQAVAGERGWLEFALSEPSRQRVLDITLAAGSLRLSADASLGRRTTPAAGHAMRWLPSLFSFGGRHSSERTEMMAPARQTSGPALMAVVKTKTDEKNGWLAAGQTVARAVLQAQALGLSWAFFNPVRRREAREALRVQIGHKGFAQVVLGFGSLAAGETFHLAHAVAPATTLGKSAN